MGGSEFLRSLAPLHCFAFCMYTVGNIRIPKIPNFPTHVCTAYLQFFSHTEGVPPKALFTGGHEIGVSEFRGAISSKIMGYEPCDFF